MDLLKIGKRKPVEIVIDDEGTSVSFRPLSLKNLKDLQTRFSDFFSILDPTSLVFNRPEVTVAILAAATGHCGEPEAENECDALGATYQVDALGKVLAMTFPGGAGPFVEALSRLGSLLGGPPGAQAGPAEQTQAETSPPPLTS